MIFHLKKTARYIFFVTTITALLSACTHTPSPQDIPANASFTTNILSDGTKLFVYSLGRAARNESDSDEREHSSGSDSDSGSPSGGRNHGSRGGGLGHSQRSPQDMQKGVMALLAQNHYCRESYVVLEQYQASTGYIIRGECRDAADSADRAKFTH